jgi:hypothetical protein|tara:strand:- start:30 stop:329 length:300 start_codon:yes stop_codon:yes gene_type:complete
MSNRHAFLANDAVDSAFCIFDRSQDSQTLKDISRSLFDCVVTFTPLFRNMQSIAASTRAEQRRGNLSAGFKVVPLVPCFRVMTHLCFPGVLIFVNQSPI